MGFGGIRWDSVICAPSSLFFLYFLYLIFFEKNINSIVCRFIISSARRWRGGGVDEQLKKRIMVRKAWLNVETALKNVLPYEDVIKVIWDKLMLNKNGYKSPYDERQLYFNMGANLPRFSITPPCSYYLRSPPKRWQVRCKWLKLIRHSREWRAIQAGIPAVDLDLHCCILVFTSCARD